MVPYCSILLYFLNGRYMLIYMCRWPLLQRISGLDSRHIGTIAYLFCISFLGHLFNKFCLSNLSVMILRSLDDVRMNLEVLKYCATVLFLVKTWYPWQLMTILIVPIVRVNFLFHRSSTYPVFPPYKLKFIFSNIYESLFSREHYECKFFSS